MIQFDLLKFDQDNNLILQVSVPDKEYFENVSLTGVYIDTHKSYSSVLNWFTYLLNKSLL